MGPGHRARDDIIFHMRSLGCKRGAVETLPQLHQNALSLGIHFPAEFVARGVPRTCSAAKRVIRRWATVACPCGFQ